VKLSVLSKNKSEMGGVEEEKKEERKEDRSDLKEKMLNIEGLGPNNIENLFKFMKINPSDSTQTLDLKLNAIRTENARTPQKVSGKKSNPHGILNKIL
jgi:hypothetical protein